MGYSKKPQIEYKVFFTKRCEHRFKKLQESIKVQINGVIEEVKKNPRTGYALQGHLLKNLYTIHAGDFRIVYKFSDNPAEVEIWAIEHRKHVYDEITRYLSSIS